MDNLLPMQNYPGGYVSPVVLHWVEALEDRALLRHLVNGYRYIGYRVPFGASISYLVYNSDKQTYFDYKTDGNR
jgi:hypothetical protein